MSRGDEYQMWLEYARSLLEVINWPVRAVTSNSEENQTGVFTIRVGLQPLIRDPFVL